MAETDGTCRLAIGIFYDPAGLQDAVADLRAAGFGDGELCVAGLREAFQGPLSGLIGPRSQIIRIDAAPPRPGEPEPLVEFIASSSELPQMLLGDGKSDAERAGPPYSLLADICKRMADHMRNGAIVLMVAAPDTALQSRSSRILLRYSTQSVQTYEFTLPR